LNIVNYMLYGLFKVCTSSNRVRKSFSRPDQIPVHSCDRRLSEQLGNGAKKGELAAT